MTWTFTDDVGVFLDAAGPSPAARPVENTLLLTVTATLARHGPHAYGEAAPVLGWWRGPDGEVGGTLVRTPPHPAVLGTVAPRRSVRCWTPARCPWSTRTGRRPRR